MTSWRYRDSRWSERLKAPIDWNPKILPVAVVTVVIAIAGSAFVIARDGTAIEIAHDAQVMTWSASVSSAAATLRADVREGLLTGQSATFDLAEDDATAESAAKIRQAISELDRQVGAVAVKGSDGGIGDAAATVSAAAASVADALVAGRVDEALAVAEDELSGAFEELTVRTTAVSQAAADEIAVANRGIGLTTAARFTAALAVPALVVFLLYRALRRSQKLSLLRTELARERELRRKKDAFVTAASHHVKTPMAAVVGFAELLRDGSGDFSDSVRDEIIALMATEANETGKVVDDLFAAARYDLGDFNLRAERLELRDVTDTITTDWARTHQTKMTISGNGTVLGNEQWLRHGIHNLLRIAASSGADEIQVVIGSEKRMSTLEISDNGAAIPSDQTERLSEIYYAQDEANGLAPTLGLGLSVARRIARAAGGDLRYERRDGSNVFTMTLPVAESGWLPGKRFDRIIDPSADTPSAASIEHLVDIGSPTVLYQPIVELSGDAGKHVAGYEALARFPSHTPSDWFKAAVRLGLSVDLELACVQAAIDHFEMGMPGPFLAVNISDETLHSSRFRALMTDVDPTSVVVELPVGASIASYASTREVLEGMRAEGLRVAIDHVGSDDSTLVSIAQLGAEIIKLDRHLIEKAKTSAHNRGLIKAITALAGEIGASVVAVGIETAGDHALADELGASHGQGDFYARPGDFDSQLAHLPSR